MMTATDYEYAYHRSLLAQLQHALADASERGDYSRCKRLAQYAIGVHSLLIAYASRD